MDTTISNMGKGVISASSGNAADEGIGLVNQESLNQAPTPSVYGEPLAVAPLTVAKPGEPVAPTPSCIRNHPAYKGGWKVLQYPRRNGTVEKTYNHKGVGRIRSLKKVMSHLDDLWNLEKKELKNSADQDKQGSGVCQSAEGNSAGRPSQSTEGSAAAINESAEGKSAAGAGYLAKGKSAA